MVLIIIQWTTFVPDFGSFKALTFRDFVGGIALDRGWAIWR